MATYGDVVRVENIGDKTRSIKYNNREYILEPGKPTVVPFEAAVLWFGNPYAGENVARVNISDGNTVFIPDREAERRRLTLLYGSAEGDDDPFAAAPKVRVLDIDTGDEVYTVTTDPDGTRVREASITLQQREDDVTRVERLDAENKEMKRRQEQLENMLREAGILKDSDEEKLDDAEEGNDEGNEDDGIPADTPTGGSSSKGPAAKGHRVSTSQPRSEGDNPRLPGTGDIVGPNKSDGTK